MSEVAPDGWAGELAQLFRRLMTTSGIDPGTGKPPSLRHVAKRSGYVPSHVRDILRGVGRPSPDAVLAVAGALNASPDDRRLAVFYAEQLQRARNDRQSAARQASRSTVARPVPRELPHDTRGFTGRDAELTQLRRLATAEQGIGTVMIITIDGSAGVGKTALAVRFAHGVAARFPDGQLHVNLRGFDPQRGALSPGHALEQFLHSLGLEARQIPADLDERTHLFRSMLAGRRMLLLLDNAATAEQVRPLLPGTAGCLAVVTSRNRLSGLVARDGAHRLNVDVLTESEALELLTELVGQARTEAEPEAASHLCRLAGYLPLALRIVGERLFSRPHLRVADLVEELGDTHDRLDALTSEGDEHMAVRAVFSWSYRHLRPQTARLFRLLSLHAGPDFSTHAAAALTDMSVPDTRRLLDDLAAASLLEQVGRDRYRFHDLLRVYATERAESEESEGGRAEAVRRVLEWYLQSAHANSRTMHPGFRQVPVGRPQASFPPATFNKHADSVQWYEVERVNLAAATRQAADIGEHELVWKLSGSVTSLYYVRKNWTEGLASYQLGLAAARNLNDGFAEAWMLTCLGGAYRDIGRLEEAAACCRAGLARWRQIGDRSGESWILVILAGTCLDRGNADEAVATCNEAIGIAQEDADRWCEAFALNHLAASYQILRRYDEVVSASERALTIWHEIGNRYGEAWSLHTLGTMARRLGRFEESVRRCRQSAAIRHEIGDHAGEAASLQSLGKALVDVGDLSGARYAWLQALRILEALGEVTQATVRARLELLDAGNSGDGPRTLPVPHPGAQ